MRQPSAEPILALGPELVLAIEDAGTPAAPDQLRDAGVPVAPVPDSHTPEGVQATNDSVAEARAGEAAGGALDRLEKRRVGKEVGSLVRACEDAENNKKIK